MEGGEEEEDGLKALVMSSLNTGEEQAEDGGGVGAPAALRGAQIMPLEV